MAITSVVQKTVQKAGSSVSAGSSSNKTTSSITQLQFPTGRASGNDGGSGDLSVTELYKNGLLFTAYDFSSRTTPATSTFRKTQLTLSTATSTTAADSVSSTNTPIANILLPRSKIDTDEVSHKFNDVGESVMTKGQGTVGGALSNIASTAVFGLLDSITSGLMADHNEQIYTTARSMYAGANNRVKNFRWTLTPRNSKDLLEIIKIHKLFVYYSYGLISNSKYAKQIKSDIDSAYNTALNTFKDDKTQKYDSLMSDITSFLTNVIVVSNPTIWIVRNFGNSTSFDTTDNNVFGPCQIQSINFDRAPDGEFHGLSAAPNMSSSFVLDITMREILTLSRDSIYTSGSITS